MVVIYNFLLFYRNNKEYLIPLSIAHLAGTCRDSNPAHPHLFTLKKVNSRHLIEKRKKKKKNKE